MYVSKRCSQLLQKGHFQSFCVTAVVLQVVYALDMSRLPGAAATPAACKQHAAAIVRAVQLLWAAGVAHGDIAERNLLLSEAGTVAIMDFGIATLQRDVSPQEWQARLAVDKTQLASLWGAPLPA